MDARVGPRNSHIGQARSVHRGETQGSESIVHSPRVTQPIYGSGKCGSEPFLPRCQLLPLVGKDEASVRVDSHCPILQLQSQLTKETQLLLLSDRHVLPPELPQPLSPAPRSTLLWGTEGPSQTLGNVVLILESQCSLWTHIVLLPSLK